jgi:hypothetical protein
MLRVMETAEIFQLTNQVVGLLSCLMLVAVHPLTCKPLPIFIFIALTLKKSQHSLRVRAGHVQP